MREKRLSSFKMFFLRPNSSCTTFSAPHLHRSPSHRRRRRFTSVPLMWQIACVFAVLFFLLKHSVGFPLSEDFSLSTCHTLPQYCAILSFILCTFCSFYSSVSVVCTTCCWCCFSSDIGTDHRRDLSFDIKIFKLRMEIHHVVASLWLMGKLSELIVFSPPDSNNWWRNDEAINFGLGNELFTILPSFLSHNKQFKSNFFPSGASLSW